MVGVVRDWLEDTGYEEGVSIALLMTALSKCISESYLLLLSIDVSAEDFSVSVSSGQQGSRPVAGKETDR